MASLAQRRMRSQLSRTLRRSSSLPRETALLDAAGGLASVPGEAASKVRCCPTALPLPLEAGPVQEANKCWAPCILRTVQRCRQACACVVAGRPVRTAMVTHSQHR